MSEPTTAAGRALLIDLVEHVETLAPKESKPMHDATATAILAIEAEARTQDGSALLDFDTADRLLHVYNYWLREHPAAPLAGRDRWLREVVLPELNRAALPPSAPPALPTRCALCGGSHLSADTHTYEELLFWENDRAARQLRAEGVDAHKDHDTDGPTDEDSGFPTCSGCGAILTDPPSAPPALDVERLAQALRTVDDSDPAEWLEHGDKADAVAAEYARLEQDR